MAWRSMMPNQTSTRLSQEADVGVKWTWIAVRLQPVADLLLLVVDVVVHHQVQLPCGVGASDLLQERKELLVPMPRLARRRHGAGGDFQGGEQGGGAVALVVVGLLLRHSRAQGQDRGGPVQRLDLGLRAPRGAALPALGTCGGSSGDTPGALMR